MTPELMQWETDGGAMEFEKPSILCQGILVYSYSNPFLPPELQWSGIEPWMRRLEPNEEESE